MKNAPTAEAASGLNDGLGVGKPFEPLRVRTVKDFSGRVVSTESVGRFKREEQIEAKTMRAISRKKWKRTYGRRQRA